jgi:hypothetical protein
MTKRRSSADNKNLLRESADKTKLLTRNFSLHYSHKKGKTAGNGKILKYLL